MAIRRIEPVAPLDVPEQLPGVDRDPDALEAIRRDAAAMLGAGATGLVTPRSEGELVAWLRAHPRERILVQGALTSLTGGAAPDREVVISTRKLNALSVDRQALRAIVGPGLVLAELQEALAEQGLFYPPAPTHDGATIGGNVATNAAGAATFKYGTTRDWVQAARFVLRSGEVLSLERGEVLLSPGDTLVIGGQRELRVPIPRYTSPALKKTSTGYRVSEPLDLLDLFIGAEGTLGIFSRVTLGLIRQPALLVGFVLLPDTAAALALTASLRRRSLQTRAALGPGGSGRGGLDVRSIEWFDRRCLELIAQEGKLENLRGHDPSGAGAALLWEQELPAGYDDARVKDRIAGMGGSDPDDPVEQLLEILVEHDLLDRVEVAMPSDHSRRAELFAIREAVPLALSDWLLRQQRSDPGVKKAGGDMIVPFDRFPEALDAYYRAFRSRGLEVAIFGHISDGNVHPNGLPTREDQVGAAHEALLDLGRTVSEMGGCPLSEHGVGRSPLKKSLLSQFWGPAPLDQMRAVKAALDPGFTLARGVLFDPPPPEESPHEHPHP